MTEQDNGQRPVRRLLTRDQILKADDLVVEEVIVPEWPFDDGEPGMVLVRGLTGRQRDEFEAGNLEQRGRRLYPNLANLRAKLVSWCVVDEVGQRVFTEEDVAVLGEKSGAPVERVFGVAARLSGMSDQDVENLIEGFGQAPGSGSSSGSRSSSERRPSGGRTGSSRK